MAQTKRTGDITELIIMSRLMIKGKKCLLPYGEDWRYDIAVDDNGKLIRIQCKTGRLRSGAIRFNVASNTASSGRKNYTKEEIDYFGVYCPDNKQTYLIPVEDVGNNEASLRVKPSRNNQTKNIRWAKDYRI